MNRPTARRPRRRLFGLYATLALAAATAAFAQQSAPSLSWSVGTAGEDLPAVVAPGYVEVTLDNDGDTGYALTLFQLGQDVPLEEFQAANARIDAAFGGEGDPTEAINAALSIANVVAELDVEAGRSQTLGTVLEPGEYVLDGAAHSEGPPDRTYRTFTVEGEPQATAPEADVTVQMVDFAFALPPDIRGGEQVWNVVNAGQQLHHMIVFQLAEGRTMEDVMAFVQSEEGEPPGEQVAYVGIMSSGQSVYQTVDLSPGEYVALCFMPDHLGDATGMPHVMLGMAQSFTIDGE